jgi:hypothetical protein
LFEDRKVRSVWYVTTEKWYISAVDKVALLTDSTNPDSYWKIMKNMLKREYDESVVNCNRLKMQSADGKFYKTDVAPDFQRNKLR